MWWGGRSWSACVCDERFGVKVSSATHSGSLAAPCRSVCACRGGWLCKCVCLGSKMRSSEVEMLGPLLIGTNRHRESIMPLPSYAYKHTRLQHALTSTSSPSPRSSTGGQPAAGGGRKASRGGSNPCRAPNIIRQARSSSSKAHHHHTTTTQQ